MKISVIIRTYNEQRHLKEVFESILKQTYKNFEIIVVDSGSNDSTPLILDEYINKYPKIFKLYYIPKDSFNYSFASNYGSERATGEILLYLSGHSRVVSKKYFQRLCDDYKKYSISACYGDVIPYLCGGINEIMFYFLGYLKNFLKPFYFDTKIHPGILSCSNASVLKSVWEKHHFVDELGDGGEDVEMANYILKTKGKILFDRKLLVQHSHHKKRKEFKEERIKWKTLYNNVLKYLSALSIY